MAWHSKWHNIKHRKAAQDAKKSKILAQLSKQIQMIAKNGADPDLNPALATAITKAKQAWLNKDAIQKAIDKWSGNLSGEDLVEVFYEWYGPAGVAIIIKAITSNTNRSAATIKSILTKYNGSMWAPGSVSWQFLEQWEIYVDGIVRHDQIKWKKVETILSLDEEDFEIALLETPAQDYAFIEEEWSEAKKIARILTSKDDFMHVVSHGMEHAWHIVDSGLQFFPENALSLDQDMHEKLQRLLDALEEDEDVDTVWHNVV